MAISTCQIKGRVTEITTRNILITTRQAKLENGQVVLGDKTNLEKENKELKKQGLPLTQDQIKSLRKEWKLSPIII